MPTLSVPEVYQLARDAHLSHNTAITATAVAIAESGLRTDAVGDVALQDAKWGPSLGLWQIRSLKNAAAYPERDATMLKEPKYNALSMALISSRGSDFSPWSTYKDGKYREHLARVQSQVVKGAGPVAPAPSTGGGGTAPTVPNGDPLWPGSSGQLTITPLGGQSRGSNIGLPGADDLVTTLLEGLVIAAGVGLGVTLVAIGAWRAVSSST